MARITAHVSTPRPPEAAFDLVADFTRAADWDPQIAAARRLDDGPLAVGSRFEVRLGAGPVRVPLVYEIATYDRPGHVVLITRSLAHHGVDDVRFAATDDGTQVAWNAEFRLRGPGRLVDPLLAVGFRRTGRAAVAGLADALDGEVVG